MAESRKRGSDDGPGWLATLLGGLVLVVLGFGLGLVAGAAYQEPKLVAEHLAGRTVDVALPTYPEPVELDESRRFGAPEPPTAPAPAAAPIGSAEPAARAPADPPKARPTPPPVAAAPSPADGFRIQVGAFGDIEGARKLERELQAAGFATEIQQEGGGARFKVRVGPLPTREAAERTARKLEARKLPTWILAPGRS